jgi:hypothetical protein
MFKRFQLTEYTFTDYLIGLAGLSILIFNIVKSATMQVTCDEAYTLSQLPPQSIWELVSYKDSYTNNHILNTLLIKGLYALTGKNLFAGRLPNILAFTVYFYFVYHFAKQFIRGNLLQLTFCALMLGNMYLTDFFGLARGYGLSVSLIMGSIYFAANYILSNNKKSYPLSWVMAILSVYAQFASLHYFLGLNLLFFIYHVKTVWESRAFSSFLKQISSQIIACGALAILIYLPIKAILRDNQIAYYGVKGFWADTVMSLVRNSLYGESYFSSKTVPIFGVLMGIGLLFAAIAAAQKWVFNRDVGTPSVFSLALLLCTVVSMVLQFHLLGNQYPIDRTALFVYPMIGLNLISGFAFLKKINAALGKTILIVVLIFSFYHFIRAATFKSYREWWYDVHTFEILDTLKSIYEKENRSTPLSFQTSPWMNPSFSFHQDVGKITFIKPMFFVGEPDTVNYYDYYYIFSDHYPALKNHYDIYKEYDWKSKFLMKRKSQIGDK